MPDLSLMRVLPGARTETPLCRLAQELGGLSGWRRYGMATLLGLLLAGALPPIDMTPLIFLVFPALLWLDEGSSGAWASARLGYVFGLGFFVGGLYWIAAALFVDIGRYWWALPFAVLGLPALMAFYSAAALGVTRLATNRFALPALARLCLFAVAWSASEWARGHLLTGFPWNLIGYVWSGAFPGALAMLQTTAWVGIYGLGLITVFAASLPALLGTPLLAPMTLLRRTAPIIATALMIAVPAGIGAARLILSPARNTDTWLRLVQPSIPQDLKWDPGVAEDNFRLLTKLSGAPSEHTLAAIVWPEAAATFLLERDAKHRGEIGALAPKDGYVITGALRGAPSSGSLSQLWNSIEAIDRDAVIRSRYDKAHLVPFGEYVPFSDLLPLKKITAGSINLSAGPGAVTINLPGLAAFAPVVCYEAIFPGAIVDAATRPGWILNVTNDAWYGRSSGPYQHFAIARTRAVEEGLPLVRAANNGISGVVDAVGRVTAAIALDTVGYADVALPAAAPPTLYSRIGDWGFAVLLLLGLVPVLRRWR